MTVTDLTYREKEVLKFIIENFVKSALPVGSRNVSKQTELNLSPASIRNIMSDLEEMELISTPHTSAGRIPTDKGYRFYVDSLMKDEKLSEEEKKYLNTLFNDSENIGYDNTKVFSEISLILGKISHQLTIVTQPFLNDGVLESIELVSLSSSKILVVLNISGGFVKTVIMEIDIEVSRRKLVAFGLYLNEKLSGLSLKVIKETFIERVKDSATIDSNLIQMFINSKDKIYGDTDADNKIFVGGRGEIILQPEFDDPASFKKIVDIAEDRNLVVHVLNNRGIKDNTVMVKIGEEIREGKLKDYSLIVSSYKMGDVSGNVGIIGPKRINYAKMITLLKYTSQLLSEIKT